MPYNQQGTSRDSSQLPVTNRNKQLYNPPEFSVEHPVENKTTYEKIMHSLGKGIGSIGKVPGLFCFPNPYKEVQQGNVGLIKRFGKFYKAVDAGLVEINVISEKLIDVSIMLQITPIGRIPVITKDNVNIEIEAVVYWHIVQPFLAMYGVTAVRNALIERTQTTLRAVAGSRVLQELIEERDSVADSITELIDKPAESWGIRVESILIKDVHFSHELQQSLSAAATQKRIGEAKVIAAQAEVDSAKLMREAADILNTPAAMQIRYLETLQSMSKNAGTKIMFVPMSDSGNHTLDTISNNLNEGNHESSQTNKGKHGALDTGVRDAALFHQLSDM